MYVNRSRNFLLVFPNPSSIEILFHLAIFINVNNTSPISPSASEVFSFFNASFNSSNSSYNLSHISSILSHSNPFCEAFLEIITAALVDGCDRIFNFLP